MPLPQAEHWWEALEASEEEEEAAAAAAAEVACRGSGRRRGKGGSGFRAGGRVRG